MNINYKTNTALHLIVASGVSYILVKAISVILIVFSSTPTLVESMEIIPNLALQPWELFLSKPWVILTYTLTYTSFWNLLSSMLWLYVFASVIQTLIGYKEVIPIFLVSTFLGGLIYLGGTALIGTNSIASVEGGESFLNAGHSIYVFTAQGVIFTYAIAAITLAPKFNYYMGDRLKVPLWLALCAFVVISIVSMGVKPTAYYVYFLISGLIGFVYIKMVRKGWSISKGLYAVWNKFLRIFINPNANKDWPSRFKEQNKHMFINKDMENEEYIDAILDKISSKGFNSLTKEEKEILKKAAEN